MCSESHTGANVPLFLNLSMRQHPLARLSPLCLGQAASLALHSTSNFFCNALLHRSYMVCWTWATCLVPTQGYTASHQKQSSPFYTDHVLFPSLLLTAERVCPGILDQQGSLDTIAWVQCKHCQYLNTPQISLIPFRKANMHIYRQRVLTCRKDINLSGVCKNCVRH